MYAAAQHNMNQADEWAMPAAAAASSQQVARSKVVRVKVISMGDMGCGKSCLIKRCAVVVRPGCHCMMLSVQLDEC